MNTNCRHCYHPMTVAEQPALMPTQQPHTLVTCDNPDCDLYQHTFTAADYPSIDLRVYMRAFNDPLNLIPAPLAIPELYATEPSDFDEKLIYVKLYTPDSGWRWYIAEYRPAEQLAFGYCYCDTMPDFAEWGYISIAELSSGRGMTRVHRDIKFKPARFRDLKAAIDGPALDKWAAQNAGDFLESE